MWPEGLRRKAPELQIMMVARPRFEPALAARFGTDRGCPAASAPRVCITCVVLGFCADRENRFSEQYRKSRMISNLGEVRIPLPPPVPLSK